MLPIRFPKVRSLGGGVAIEIESPGLIQLQHHLAQGWNDWLSKQDRQGYRPHVTIQNKVTADEARQLYDRLSSEWQPLDAYGEAGWFQGLERKMRMDWNHHKSSRPCPS